MLRRAEVVRDKSGVWNGVFALAPSFPDLKVGGVCREVCTG